MWRRLAAVCLLCAVSGTASSNAETSPPSCFGSAATIVGTNGDDKLLGTPGPDVIVTLDGNDNVVDAGGDDRICLGPGSDAVEGGPGNDSIDGGDGGDSAYYYFATGPLRADLQTGVATATGEGRDTLSGIENLDGTNFNDTLTGDGNTNILTGEGGNDTIDGGGQSDALDGGRGNDRLIGHVGDGDAVAYVDAATGVNVDLETGVATGDGTDAISGVDSVIGSLYADKLVGDPALNFLVGFGGPDQLDGRGGFDIAAFVKTVSANLATGIARSQDGVSTLANIEGLGGSPEADQLTGNAGHNFLESFGGNDVLSGAGGPDLIFGDQGSDELSGGSGDDKLVGGADNDRLDGGAGSADTVSYINAPSAVRADLAAKTATGEGTDTLVGVENLSGSAYADILTGDARPNELFGNGGNDDLSAGGGADFVGGGAGNDSVQAGAGSDYCLDDQPGRGCEITGAPHTPGAAKGPPVPARVVAFTTTGPDRARPVAAQRETVLAWMARSVQSIGAVRRSIARARTPSQLMVTTMGAAPEVRKDATVSRTANYEYSAEPVCISGKNGGTAEIAPPNVVHPVGNDDRAEEAWWQGTLYKQTGTNGPFRKLQARTGWARAQLAGNVVLPGGVVVWKDASGRRAFRSPIPFKVPSGRYVWKGQIYWVRSGGRIFAPVEPHIIRAQTIQHNKNCVFG